MNRYSDAMGIVIVMFVGGVCLFQQMPALLPVWGWAGAVAVLIAGVVVALRCRQGSRRGAWLAYCSCALLAGFLWGDLRAAWRLQEALDPALEGRDLVIDGRVATMPEHDGARQRFVFEAEVRREGVPRRLLLSWYARGNAAPVAVQAGERWRLTLRLRRPAPAGNPHGFDYAAWLLERGVLASGYVRRGEALPPRMVLDPTIATEGLRQKLAVGLQQAAPGHALGIVRALSLGDRSGLGPHDWQVLRDTGTAHLVSVSGLHVGALALLAGGCAGWLWRRRARNLLWIPARQVAVAAGLLLAGGYVLLSGLGIPAQRAWLMLAVVGCAMLARRRVAPWQALALALGVVVLVDPWAVLGAGFWLSFGAVALIGFLLLGEDRRHGMLWRGARLQWGLSLAMAPLLLILFGRVPLVSPLANLLAVPFVTLLLMPVSLLATVLPWSPLVVLADGSGAAMMQVLARVADLPGAVWQQAIPPLWLVLPGLAGLLWALLPRGTPGRVVAAVACVPLFLWQPERPAAGEVWVRVLDVGQGLSVHLQTATHDYLYDAGPDWSGERDAGSSIVLPYLRAAGVRRLDALVLSHDDADHTGGAASVMAGLPVRQLWSSLPGDAARLEVLSPAVARARCTAGQGWQADGVAFAFLHPAAGDYVAGLADNTLSCVLRVEAGGQVLLLPGDLDRPGEERLLVRSVDALQAAVVVAGHHGSRSSSSPAWVAAVRAREVAYSAGRRNRFHHPDPVIVGLWEGSGARSWRTDRDGSVLFRLGADGVDSTAWRVTHRHYWD